MKGVNFIANTIKRRPMTSFFVVLVLLLVVIVAGSFFRKPEEVSEEEMDLAKETQVFTFDQIPRMSLAAKIDKKSSITINATTNGIVKYINTYTGEKVYPGKTLISLADTYGGSNVSAVDLAIARKTKEINDITYEKNDDILDWREDQLPKTDKEEDEIPRKEIKIQKRNLDLNKETTDLNLKKASIVNALHYPSAPTAGLVEKIHIKPGQQVQAGTPLVSFVSDNNQVIAEVMTSFEIAQMISVNEPSKIIIRGDEIETAPIYISQNSTGNQQYSVFYSIPEKYSDQVVDSGFIEVQIPLENNGEKENELLVPVDAVQLTQEKAYVFVVGKDNEAESVEVELGNVFGQFVQVKNGISKDDRIILNRNVFEGDNVSIIED